MLAILALKHQATRSIASALDGLSPLAVLGRGYSIVQTMPDGIVVKRVRDVCAGDRVSAKLADGRLLCDVRKILPDS